MATAARSLPTGQFSIGRIFALAVETMRHNPVQLLFLALLFGAAPILLTSYGLDRFQDAQGSELSFQTWAVFSIGTIVSTAVSTLPQAFLTLPVIAEAEGRRSTVSESVRTGLIVAIPTMVMGLVYAVAVITGLAVLIIPGFMLMAAWAITAPALVVERRGILRAFWRSQQLTRGVRWKIAGLLLLFYSVYICKEAAVQLVSGEWDNTSLAVAYQNPIYVALATVTETILVVFWCSVLAALYVELRDWKDGPAANRLAEIFA